MGSFFLRECFEHVSAKMSPTSASDNICQTVVTAESIRLDITMEISKKPCCMITTSRWLILIDQNPVLLKSTVGIQLHNICKTLILEFYHLREVFE